MTAAPKIGITMYAPNARQRYELPVEYVESVRRAGGLPLLMPPGEPRLGEWLSGIDALILAGGGDLAPETPGAPPAHETTYDVYPARDRDELELARHVLGSQLPALCICRGLQVLNVAAGGTLHPHLPDLGDRIPHRTDDRQPLQHQVTLCSGSRLAQVVGATSANTASWHHQAIDRLAEGFDVVARAPDDTIEAIERPGDARLFAVQWHPELTAADDPSQQRLFDELIRLARS